MNRTGQRTTNGVQLLRTLLIVLGLMIYAYNVSFGQSVTYKDANGITHTIEQTQEQRDTLTGRIFLTGKLAYEVFKGKRGGMYYWRKSRKTGKLYKVYVKEEETIVGTL